MYDIFSLPEFEFPENFLWGSGGAGHQVEGNNIHYQSIFTRATYRYIFKQRNNKRCNYSRRDTKEQRTKHYYRVFNVHCQKHYGKFDKHGAKKCERTKNRNRRMSFKSFRKTGIHKKILHNYLWRRKSKKSIVV